MLKKVSLSKEELKKLKKVDMMLFQLHDGQISFMNIEADSIQHAQQQLKLAGIRNQSNIMELILSDRC